MEISEGLVRRLVAAQHPRWADLPVRAVEHGGWDNRTFRLGHDMTVRLPSAEEYAAAVAKEQEWLPRLAPTLPLPVPTPLAAGVPGEGYPFRWSVYGWIDGEPATVRPFADDTVAAADLADFLVALRRAPARGGPLAGAHSFQRGGPPASYDDETRSALGSLVASGERFDAASATAVWDRALASRWTAPPVWFHGDASPGNLLVRDGRLHAVIDFGTSGVGDPACDTVPAWTMFSGRGREVFRQHLGLDEETWARGRGWALWKALITLAGDAGDSRDLRAGASRTLAAVLADHRATTAGR